MKFLFQIKYLGRLSQNFQKQISFKNKDLQRGVKPELEKARALSGKVHGRRGASLAVDDSRRQLLMCSALRSGGPARYRAHGARVGSSEPTPLGAHCAGQRRQTRYASQARCAQTGAAKSEVEARCVRLTRSAALSAGHKSPVSGPSHLRFRFSQRAGAPERGSPKSRKQCSQQELHQFHLFATAHHRQAFGAPAQHAAVQTGHLLEAGFLQQHRGLR